MLELREEIIRRAERLEITLEEERIVHIEKYIKGLVKQFWVKDGMTISFNRAALHFMEGLNQDEFRNLLLS